MSKRCIPFNLDKDDIDKLDQIIEKTDLIKAIDNIKILANLNGVGTFCLFSAM